MSNEISYTELSRELGQIFAEKADIYISEFFDLPRILDASIMKTGFDYYMPKNNDSERTGAYFMVRAKSRRSPYRYPIRIETGRAEHMPEKFVPMEVRHTCEDSLYRSNIFACSHIAAAMMEVDKYQPADNVSTIRFNKTILSEWKKIRKIPDNRKRLALAYRALGTHLQDDELKPLAIMNARLDYLMRRSANGLR